MQMRFVVILIINKFVRQSYNFKRIAVLWLRFLHLIPLKRSTKIQINVFLREWNWNISSDFLDAYFKSLWNLNVYINEWLYDICVALVFKEKEARVLHIQKPSVPPVFLTHQARCERVDHRGTSASPFSKSLNNKSIGF
ncbi:hypothetical protein VNO77_23880 [Canavalia gladiata]|uniref:Uncharacterized protein n=1 Tax=Canavalia gladiata TaxID=3824 RepID=A0AAN9Q9C7_CANGL